jgi:hypothetical protein
MQNVDLQIHRNVSFSNVNQNKTTQILQTRNEPDSENLYFLFLGMVYLMLKSDSKFLQEFAFLWEESNL